MLMARALLVIKLQVLRPFVLPLAPQLANAYVPARCLNVVSPRFLAVEFPHFLADVLHLSRTVAPSHSQVVIQWLK